MMNKIVVLCLLTVCSCGGDENGKVSDVFDLPEGSICVWNGLQGKCTNINNCQSAKEAVQRKTHPPICSFQETTPIVCCTICKQDRAITDRSKDFALESKYNQSSKARDNCFKYLKTLEYPCILPPIHPNLEEERSLSEDCFGFAESSTLENAENSHSATDEDSHSGNLTSKVKRHAKIQAVDLYPPLTTAPAISRGKEAYRRQYPHMALLGFGDDLETAQWLCGGSVISEKYILTAAHCISSPAVGPVKFAAMGILKRSDNPKYWQNHNVKRVIAHPKYQPPSKYNDIALLETEKLMSFNTDVLPACLPLVPESDETAEATGWGALGHRQGLADVLQTVKLQRYDAEKCSQLYPKHRHLREGYNHTSQMCYGDTQEAKDTCEGDSGGPLQTSNVFLHCAYTVLGVTSYGRQCGISAGSGMYTRVYHYVPWIESIVWP